MTDDKSQGSLEGIDQPKVTEWLTEHVDGLQPPLEFSLTSGGHSNLTYRFEDRTGAAYVLRRPPLGHVLESAHDMAREHRIITAVGRTRALSREREGHPRMERALSREREGHPRMGRALSREREGHPRMGEVPVPRTFGLCEDPEVNGAPFYIMNFVEGTVLHEVPTAAAMPEADRFVLGDHVIHVLATLHAVDFDAIGLGTLAKKEAYIERQLKRWSKQYEATKTHDIPEMDESERLLREDIPEQIGASIVHGDYRLGNMMTRDAHMVALLDWELCTLGDPLADLGYLLNNWTEPGEVEGDTTPTSVGGFPPREHLCRVYTERTGRDISRINYYRAFSHWRLAAIGQGVYKRYLVGAMGKDREFDLEAYKKSVHVRAEAALRLLTE